jgi:uncharacterized protein (TIGR02246 family)
MSVQAVEAVAPVRAADASAVFDLVRRVVEAWKVGDADKFTSVFAPTAVIALPGVILKGQGEIKAAMTEAFADKWAGTYVHGTPVDVRQLGDDAITVVTEGGPYRPGATEIPMANAIRALWCFGKTDGQWQVTAYVNTPAGSAVAIPEAR